jgi:hypothetical protein
MNERKTPPPKDFVSSPVPFGPASEAGAAPGTGQASPGTIPLPEGEAPAPVRPPSATDVDPASDLADQTSAPRPTERE